MPAKKCVSISYDEFLFRALVFEVVVQTVAAIRRVGQATAERKGIVDNYTAPSYCINRSPVEDPFYVEVFRVREWAAEMASFGRECISQTDGV